MHLTERSLAPLDRPCVMEDLNSVISTGCQGMHIWKDIELEAYNIANKTYRNSFSIEESAGYCVFMACKIHNVPRTLCEIASYFEIDKYKLTKIIKLNNEDCFVSCIRCSDIAKRLCWSILDLSYKNWIYLGKVADYYQYETGSFPQPVLGATIYKHFKCIPCSDNLNDIDRIATVCHCSISSIKKTLNKLISIALPPRSLLYPQPDTVSPFFYAEAITSLTGSEF